MMDDCTAYAYGDGTIGVMDRGVGGLPAGALFLARGPRDRLLAVIGGMARRGHEPGLLLVPGVPEAADADTAFRAFVAFFERVQVQLGPDSNFPTVRREAGAPW